jgi:hypothetical protein
MLGPRPAGTSTEGRLSPSRAAWRRRWSDDVARAGYSTSCMPKYEPTRVLSDSAPRRRRPSPIDRGCDKDSGAFTCLYQRDSSHHQQQQANLKFTWNSTAPVIYQSGLATARLAFDPCHLRFSTLRQDCAGREGRYVRLLAHELPALESNVLPVNMASPRRRVKCEPSPTIGGRMVRLSKDHLIVTFRVGADLMP